MTLESKGPIVPPPTLKGPAQQTSATVQGWPGIVSATHWNLYHRTEPDGADFYVGKEELGHIHLNGEVHLATSLPLAQALLKANLARPFPYGDGWVLYQIRTQADAAHAEWLFRLNYQRLNGSPLQSLKTEIAEKAAKQSR